MLAEYIEDQSNWRHQKHAEHPDDQRNEQAADALIGLAQYVRDLPSDDPRLQELQSLGMVDGVDVFMAGPETSRAISRFRFNNTGKSCGDFLTELVSIARDDALEMANMAGLLDPG